MKKINKRIQKTLIKIFALGLASATLFTGCAQKASADDGKEQVRKVIVGTGNGYEPYCYLDDNGDLAGYEYEVLKEVDKLLPQYEFEYQTSDFTNVLISLDAGKIDIAAHQYEYNDERNEKYLFGTEPYTTYVTYLVVSSDNEDIKSLDDLAGKTIYTGGNTAC